MDISHYRQDFPLLKNLKGVYFDTACQSLRPYTVIEAVKDYYEQTSACSGRSMHTLAARVTQQVDQARTIVARFIGASKKEEIVFTRNTTEGINLVADSLDFHTGDIVLVTAKEHNSNLIPWQKLTRNAGINLKIIPVLPDNTFDMESYRQMLIEGSVRLVAVGMTSNLDGVSVPCAEIAKLAHNAGARVLFDAAQYAPHYKLNVKSLDCDFLAFSGHKMLGPSGTGILYGRYSLLEAMQPFMVGGETVASSTYTSCEFLPPPEKFEAGLQDYAGIIGLCAALEYLQKVGFDAIQRQELELNRAVTAGLAELPGLRIIGPADPAIRGSIFTFYLDGIDSHRVALMLDQMGGIMVRSGQHCVHSWFNAHQIAGSVRASMYFYNTLEEIERLVENVRKIRKVL